MHDGDQTCGAVRVTLGPKSKRVLIGKKWRRPLVCNDKVTIAKEVLSGLEQIDKGSSGVDALDCCGNESADVENGQLGLNARQGR